MDSIALEAWCGRKRERHGFRLDEFRQDGPTAEAGTTASGLAWPGLT